MKYLSICSGIEAATVAWHHMGWSPVGFAEIEKFPAQVLAHHYPNTPNFGDLTKHESWNIESGTVDLLVGGTPCQAFSVAGLRRGMDDERGQLTLEFVRLAARLRPRWIVWENVPGVLSSAGGRDFGSFLGALGELGYGWAYRILDAQYFGVAQRRRRVFVVGYLGDWRCAAAVLFERESMRRDSAPSREAGQRVAPTVGTGAPFSRTGNGSEADALQPYAVANCLTARMHKGINSTLDEGQTPVVAPTITAANDPSRSPQSSEVTQQVWAVMQATQAVAIGLDEEQNARVDGFGTLKARMDGGGFEGSVMTPAMAVRRLTPVECERLQGFPDGYTNIPWRGKSESPDGPRYKTLGNSMAVPVMRWIGERMSAYVNRSLA